MKIVYQRVSGAAVKVEGEEISRIGRGVLLLLAVERGDTTDILEWGVKKSAELRCFADDEGKMNLSLLDVKGEALVVSQFTLAGKVKKGRRPSFDKAEDPQVAVEKYQWFCDRLADYGVPVQQGSFGAMMEVELVNDGPVTFIIEKSHA